MRQVFQTLYHTLQQGQPAVLATVISRKGSLPMSDRARMLVLPDGTICGTVGGGIIEAAVIEEALGVLETRMSKVRNFDLTSEQIESEGMTCGGRAGIFLEYFSPDNALELVHQLAQRYNLSEHAVVASILPRSRKATGRPAENRRFILTRDGRLIGSSGDDTLDLKIRDSLQLYFKEPVLKVVTIELGTNEATAVESSPENSLELFVETVVPAPTVYLFGGGHVSQHLAEILPGIGFEYVVCDDRQEFVTKNLFPHAKDLVCCDFATVLGQLQLSAQSSYLVIVTRGHASDLVVLRQAMQRELKYVGMIGSKRKVALLLEELRKEGLSEAKLKELHAPIGLPIGADTLEEIAISIAAELIQVRRKG
ncbi:hypothetical protein CSB45_11805 [candidate division KSB3 bacterium]|uniref:Dehydrogenase n=1 Tax=candidate division KSB3 bacterium TaxID=2044937 RepID=A0A2G6E3P0_9BACT|nr:MAG: hypothetical protein CSB45_11805 [candidate division KSB3 bacterium]PIE29260.1 MAG: hypothetical protein CSA57_09645 [candidate division KSB3 bacterium]